MKFSSLVEISQSSIFSMFSQRNLGEKLYSNFISLAFKYSSSLLSIYEGISVNFFLIYILYSIIFFNVGNSFEIYELNSLLRIFMSSLDLVISFILWKNKFFFRFSSTYLFKNLKYLAKIFKISSIDSDIFFEYI